MSPDLFAVASMVLWVVVEGFVAVAARDVSLLQVVWLRYATHTLLMLLMGLHVGTRFLQSRQLPLQIGRSLLMAVMPVSFILARRELPAGDVMAFFWAAPLLVLLFARLLGERWPGAVLVLAASAWAGVLVARRPDVVGAGAASMGLVLMMAASFALYVAVTPLLDRTDGALTNVFYSAAGVLVALTPALPFVWRTPTIRAWIACIAVGALGLVALWLLDVALRRAPAWRVSIFLFAQFPVGLVLGALARRDRADAATWIGAALVVGAMAAARRLAPPAGASGR